MTYQGYNNSFFANASQTLITGGSFIINSTSGKSAYDRLLEATAPNAYHDSGHTCDQPKCHPGTRVAIMQTIFDWVSGINEESRDKGINWLSGPAGSGKSAIGRSICELSARTGKLLASFFFGSRDPTRNHSKTFVATIAYQICSINSSLCSEICTIIEYDPLIFTKSLRTQFECLVMNPIAKIYTTPEPQHPPNLIVIDGLDECLDQASQRDILQTLLHLITSYPSIPIRFLVCSRPESNITSVFNGAHMSAVIFKIFLGDEYSPDTDIELYLCDRFKAIRDDHIFKQLIPCTWPTRNQIDQLVDRSSGQFIYASTVVRYVDSPRHLPHQRLEVILGLRPPFKDLPFAELDALYTHILTTTDNPTHAIDILVYLALYDNTMLISVIQTFLQLEAEDVQVVLSDLSALVDMYISCAGFFCASLVHKSFTDFIFDSSRSKHLSRDYAETRAKHILFSIQAPFEKQKGCQFMYTSPEDPFGIRRNDIDRIFQECSIEVKRDILNALIQFPMKSLCKDVFSCPRKVCGEGSFLRGFFTTLSALEKQQPDSLMHVFDRHMRTFWECTLSQIRAEYSDHLKINFIFTGLHLKRFPALPELYSIHSDVTGVFDLLNFDKTRAKNHIVQNLLSPGEQSRIIARAAIFCLEHLCDMACTKEEANQHLRVTPVMRRKGKTRTWVRWHRQTSTYVLAEKTVKKEDTWEQRLTFSSYKSILCMAGNPDYGFFPIYSLYSFNWAKWKPDPTRSWNNQQWFRYLVYMKYLIKILPLAGRYDRLIHLCKRKAFASMSMMFPTVSRRARRQIANYLERMELKDG